MKDRKKIIFVLPETKWWAFFVYSWVAKNLEKKWYNIKIINSKIWWLKSNFLINNNTIIFSVIPFLFRFLKKRFYYILVWNYLEERKKNSLWVKLLYFTERNFSFSDKIILMNKYLLNRINILKKYQNKIKIIPNYIDFLKYENIRNLNLEKLKNKKFFNLENINILTITWFKFYDKAKWVVNLKKVLFKLAKKYPNKKIIWNIAWNSDNKIFKKVKEDFDKIEKPNNLKINWLWWIEEKELFNQYKKNDLFLYWTELDVFPTILLEVWSAWLPMLVNNFESFNENVPEKFICKSEDEMLKKIENLHFEENQKLNIENSKKYDIEKIIQQFIKLIEI